MAESDRPSAAPQPFVVLLVDDDIDVLAANARFLRLHDVTVYVCDSAESALARLQEVEIDVVVTDLKMPGCNGIEFARCARTFKPLVPILFFSAYATVPDVVEAMKLGAVDFLEKPVEPDTLLRILHALRDRYDGALTTRRLAFDISDNQVPFKLRVLAFEKFLIESQLNRYKGNVMQVMESLQISRRTLNDKMSRLGISRKTSE